jgi:hypothetical protein
MSLDWKHPFTAIVSGPTGCGKTQFCLKLIKNSATVISPPPARIIWCYGVYQSVFDGLTDVEFHEGIPSLELFDGVRDTLLVLDDLMSETDKRVTDIFTKISHHKKVSVLYLTQNLFSANKQNRTISLNSHYLVLFKNPRDATQIEAFKDATEAPFSYLLIDLKPETDDKFRFLSRIFPDDAQHFAYVPK